MVTEVRSRSNNAVWIIVGIVAILAILAIAFMAMNGRDETADLEILPPVTTAPIVDTGSAAADSAAAAARAAQDAASSAANSAADATANAAGRVTATVPAPGDSTVTVTTPAR